MTSAEPNPVQTNDAGIPVESGTPIGSPIIGAVSQAASPRWALALGAVGCTAAAIIGARWSRHGQAAGQAATRGTTIPKSSRARHKHAA